MVYIHNTNVHMCLYTYCNMVYICMHTCPYNIAICCIYVHTYVRTHMSKYSIYCDTVHTVCTHIVCRYCDMVNLLDLHTYIYIRTYIYKHMYDIQYISHFICSLNNCLHYWGFHTIFLIDQSTSLLEIAESPDDRNLEGINELLIEHSLLEKT